MNNGEPGPGGEARTRPFLQFMIGGTIKINMRMHLPGGLSGAGECGRRSVGMYRGGISNVA